MSNWVSPAVAAEMWGWTVDQVYQAVTVGTVPSRLDGQFLFVNLNWADEAETTSTPDVGQLCLTLEEIAALEQEVPLETGPDISQWRAVRHATSRKRRPPSAPMQ